MTVLMETLAEAVGMGVIPQACTHDNPGFEEADAGPDSREQGNNVQLSTRWVTITTPGIMPRLVKLITIHTFIAWLDG